MLKIFIKNDIIIKLSKFDNLHNINIDLVADKTMTMIYNEITLDELDNLIAEICINMTTIHPDYSYLAGNILVFNLHNKTLNDFSSKMELLSKKNNQINDEWLKWILLNSEDLNKIIDYSRDYNYDYFGFKTLEKSYLLKINNTIIERPQDMIMRTAVTLQLGNLELIKKTYDYISLGYYTHATPTLFNSGTNHMQLSSCFVENTEVMTMDGIKKIQNVEINNEIVTHTGKVNKVLQIHKNLLNNRKIMLLSVYNTKNIFVTDNHKFLSISKNNYKPEWRSINELNYNHFIAIPSYKSNNLINELNINNIDINNYNTKINIDYIQIDMNISQYYIDNLNNRIIIIQELLKLIIINFAILFIFKNNSIKLNNDIVKLLGLYLKCGSILQYNYGIKFIIPIQNDKIINFISETIKSHLNLSIIIVMNDNINYEIYCYSNHLSIIFDYMLI